MPVSCGTPAHDGHWVGREIYFCVNPVLKHLSKERRLGSGPPNEKDLVTKSAARDPRASQSLLSESWQSTCRAAARRLHQAGPDLSRRPSRSVSRSGQRSRHRRARVVTLLVVDRSIFASSAFVRNRAIRPFNRGSDTEDSGRSKLERRAGSKIWSRDGLCLCPRLAAEDVVAAVLKDIQTPIPRRDDRDIQRATAEIKDQPSLREIAGIRLIPDRRCDRLLEQQQGLGGARKRCGSSGRLAFEGPQVQSAGTVITALRMSSPRLVRRTSSLSDFRISADNSSADISRPAAGKLMRSFWPIHLLNSTATLSGSVTSAEDARRPTITRPVFRM